MSWCWTIAHDMVVRRIGSGPELVWIHGLGEQSSSFDAICARLPGFTHVLPDLPGYGRSAPIDESLEATADRLVRFIGDRAPLVAGHSMGGVLAQYVAERTRVAGVIDIDGNLTRGDCTFSAQALAYSRADFLAQGFDVMRDELYKRGIADPALRGYYVGMRMADPSVFHRHATELVAISETEVLVERFAALRVPVLFIAGVPGGICERSRTLLSKHGMRWVGIEPAGHWPFIDQPDAFAAAVRSL